MWEHLCTASGAWEITSQPQLLWEGGGTWGKKEFISASLNCFPLWQRPGHGSPAGLGREMAALGWGKASDPRQSSQESPAATTPAGMQLALHPAQRAENKLLTLLEFGLCLVIPLWLGCNTFFLPVNFVFPTVFEHSFFFWGDVWAGGSWNNKATETTPKPWNNPQILGSEAQEVLTAGWGERKEAATGNEEVLLLLCLPSPVSAPLAPHPAMLPWQVLPSSFLVVTPQQNHQILGKYHFLIPPKRSQAP